LTNPEARKRRVDFKAQHRQFLEWDICDAPEVLLEHIRKYSLDHQVIILNSKKKKNYKFSEIILNTTYQKYQDDVPYLVKVCHSIDGEIFKDGALLAVLQNIEDTSDAKNAAHTAFDPIWKNGHMTRSEAYRWLSWKMRTEKLFCHISMFDQQQCQEAIAHCKRYFQELSENQLAKVPIRNYD
jgi:hypothetical protein